MGIENKSTNFDLRGFKKHTPIQCKYNDLSFAFDCSSKYFAVRVEKSLYLYETSNWNLKYKLSGVSGNVYWDANGLYLGVGESLLPIKHILANNN